MSENVNKLFQGAHDEGLISGASMNALLVPDVGANIQAAMGTPAALVAAAEAFLFSLGIDDSQSIRFEDNEEVIVEGHNLVLDAVIESKQNEGVLWSTRYLNGHVLNEYMPVEEAERLSMTNYQANLGTPLYDFAVVLLGAVLAKAQELENNGQPCRTATLIVTDGRDEHSVRSTADTVKTIVQDMLMMETHIIAAMGIDDGGRTDFRRVFKDMGIRPEWILTPANSASEIRQAFNVFSKTSAQASQSAVDFSKTAFGGFGTTE